MYILKNKVIYNLIPYFFSYLNIFFKNGVKNYFLFFLFDIISLHIFKRLSKNININFSLIFLNSLAHFQHNNWDNKKNEKDYFVLSEQIFEIIFDISKNYDSFLIYNSFSQKKIRPEYILRPNNPEFFFKANNIKFKKLHSNMTNGVLITFKNHKTLKEQYSKIDNINILGLKLFEIEKINHIQIFCRIKVRSKAIIDINNYNKFQITKNLFCELKDKKIKKHVNQNIKFFLQNISFIKTTSKHTSNGELFYHNLNIKSKKIENIRINNIIKDYFK